MIDTHLRWRSPWKWSPFRVGVILVNGVVVLGLATRQVNMAKWNLLAGWHAATCARGLDAPPTSRHRRPKAGGDDEESGKAACFHTCGPCGTGVGVATSRSEMRMERPGLVVEIDKMSCVVASFASALRKVAMALRWC